MRASGLCFDAIPRYTFFGQRNPRWVNVVLCISLALLIGYVASLALQVSMTMQETRSISQQIQNTQPFSSQVTKTHRATEPSSVKVAETDRKALNGVIQQLNIPWHDIFEQLESSIPPDVALLSIEPDGQRGQIRLQAEAKSLDSLLRYASTLQHNGIFGRLNYSKHETNDQDPNRPVRLSFELGLSTPQRLKDSSQQLGQGGRNE